MKPTYSAMFRQIAFLTVCFSLGAHASAESEYVVHEWGTFTSLQNESGDAIGGINTDDEPVPAFVHRLAVPMLWPTQVPPAFFQGAPHCHPDVTMRLETPVLYFHPAASETNIQIVSVHVKFGGGWLSEYYPQADLTVPGLTNGQFQFGRLDSGTVSTLDWNNLKIGGHWPMTNTTAYVWTSPRDVKAAEVRTEGGEAEKFLFYRGVAHLDAPLRISCEAGQFVFRSHVEDLPAFHPTTLRSVWLVDILSNAKIAFRSLRHLTLDTDSNKILARTPASFDARDYSASNLNKLKSDLKRTLITEGLYADEADALLNTWELSYFKSAGLRVFFIVPRQWTDHYLPLQVSFPSIINRVMVGRIELVTPEERAELTEIAQFPLPQVREEAVQLRNSFLQHYNREMETGQRPLTAFLTVPKSYQTYLDLGRFRNALILDEARQHFSPGLTNFIAQYALEGYQPATR